jgi:hypothetical protein
MIQRLIKINHLTKQKIAEMCVVLLPKVGYARVTGSGLVVLKEHWWSLRWKKLPVTDIIIKYLPIEIGKLICKKDQRDVYVAVFNDKVATVVSLTKYTPRLDLLDYVYKEYAKACMIDDPDDIVLSYSEPLPMTLPSFNIKAMFKKSKVETSKYKISDKIKKLKSRVRITNPVILVRTRWEQFLWA